MRYGRIVALALAGALFANATYADDAASMATEAQSCPVNAYFGTVYKSGFLSNGTLVHDDWVLQSYAAVTFAGFNLNVWNSWDPGETYATDCYACETDVELDYGSKIGDWDYMVGVATWMYATGHDWSDDWVGKLDVGYNGWYIRPEVTARFGLYGQQGCYGQFILSRTHDFGSGISAKAYSIVGYASKSWRDKKGVDADGFVDFEVGGRISYAVCDNASVAVGCQYSSVIADALRDSIAEGRFWEADGDADHFLWYVGADIWF